MRCRRVSSPLPSTSYFSLPTSHFLLLTFFTCRFLRLTFRPQPHHRLPFRREEFGRDLRHLVAADGVDLRQDRVHGPVRLAVQAEAGEAVHPADRALEREQ